jgi:hypothetical protein
MRLKFIHLIIGEENFKKKQKSNGAEMGNFDSEKGNESLRCVVVLRTCQIKWKEETKKSNEKGSKRGELYVPWSYSLPVAEYKERRKRKKKVDYY